MKKQIHNFSKLQKKIFIICGVLILIFVSIIFINSPDDMEEYKTYTYKLEQPELYDGPLIIKTFKNTFSIKPVNAKENVQKIVDEKNPNIIKYIEAYKNTDIVQTRQTNKLKEDIILKQPGHPQKFSYQLDLENYEFEKTGDGDFIFYEKGKMGQELYKAFTIPAPFMIEQKNLGTEELKNERTKDIGEVEMFIEGNRLILTPDKEWIENHNYPIIVDPTIEINILNLHSHPQQGDNWEVEFTTQGQADLYIIPDDQATIDDDEFSGLYCGAQEMTPQILTNDVIYYPDWECMEVAKVVHYTLVAGKHTLRFKFGDEVAYAYNSFILTLRPNAAGDVTELDPTAGSNWQNVDEVVADEGTTVVGSWSYTLIRDLYNLPNHTSEQEVINSVTVYARCGSGNAIKTIIKTGGTEYFGIENEPPTWTTYSTIYNTNPNTGAAFTWTDIDNLQIGVAATADSCVTEGTPILMANGSHKNIEDLEVGDKLASYDIDSKVSTTTEVVFLHSAKENHVISINDTLIVADDHRVYCNGVFIKAKEVKIGDTLLNEKDEYVKVYSIQEIGIDTVYPISLKPFNVFFAGGYLIHNQLKSSGDCTQVYVEVDYTPPPISIIIFKENIIIK